jgi:membrane protease YdiL (CAAX protease family)
MLFLLKRTNVGGLAGLVVLTLLAFLLRQFVPHPLEITYSLEDLRDGVLVVGVVLVSDGTIHGLLLLAFGQAYRRRHLELAAVFRGQSFPAILLGGLMAGVGEEMLFRGLDPGMGYLLVGAVVFGLMHHIRSSLWPFTAWAVWQGLLFAFAMMHFQRLGVTMTAHFLHDVAGFLAFRFLVNRGGEAPAVP